MFGKRAKIGLESSSLPKSIVQALGTDEGLQQALDSMTIINVPIDNSSVETVCINKNGNSTYFQ